MSNKQNKNVAFYTLGCKVNQYETNAMIQEFKSANYTIVDIEQKADVYVINTCTVTNMADRKSRQMLRRVKELNPNAILVAVGCYAQVAKEELEKIPEIDLILGNNEKKDVISFVGEMLEARAKRGKNENERENKSIDSANAVKDCESRINNNIKNTIKTNNSENEKNYCKTNKVESNNNIKKANITDVLHCEEYVDFGDVTFTEKTRAVIKVQDGCDRFCSYCIIPFARGHIRSRKPDSVVSEITKIAKQGIKEVVITGIHLASYGRDFKEKDVQELLELKSNNMIDYKPEKKADNEDINIDASINTSSNNEYRLIDLLEEINKIDGIDRIRLRVIRTNTYYRRICGKII